MSFIAKMNVNAARLFSDGNVMLNIQCVYDTALGEAENEDVRFTKASPYGEGHLTVEPGPDAPQQGTSIYLTFDDQKPDNFDLCMFALPVQICEVFETPHSRKATFRPAWGTAKKLDDIPPGKRIAKEKPSFEMSMSVDNPGAYQQLGAGKTFWMQVFDASKFSMTEAIHNARKHRGDA